MSAAVTRPRFRLALDLAPGTYTIPRARRTPSLVIAGLLVGRSPRRPRLWWSRPMPADVCSMFARMPRYAPAASGIRSESRIPATGQNGSSRHFSAPSGTRSEGNLRTEQRTLNPRVRGSSPWRRTCFDLGFHRSRSFLCVRFVPMFAPCLLALLAGAQRAPGFLVVLHRIPAHAQARSGQEQRGTSVVGRSGHGRPLYAGRLTFHPRRTARLAHGRRPAAQLDSQPEVLDLLAHQFGPAQDSRSAAARSNPWTGTSSPQTPSSPR